MNRQKGIQIIITSGMRTFEEQQALQKTGKAAAPGKSWHNYGLAIDIALKNSSNWARVGQIGMALGLRWGKYFINPQSERWHFDAGNWGLNTQQLLQRVNAGNTTDGFVSLAGSKIPGSDENDVETTPTDPIAQSMPTPVNQKTDEYNGQNYIAGNKEECNTNRFNRKDATKIERNENDQKSDEREEKPTQDKSLDLSSIEGCDDASFEKVAKSVIENLEGGYYNPSMLDNGKVSDKYEESGETLYGIDRKNWGNSTPDFDRFWELVDNANAKEKWTWNYPMGSADANNPLQTELKSLAAKMIKQRYEEYSQKYMTSEARKAICGNPQAEFNFIYAAWNGPEWFKYWGAITSDETAAGTSPERIGQIATDLRANSGNELIAKGGAKIKKLLYGKNDNYETFTPDMSNRVYRHIGPLPKSNV